MRCFGPLRGESAKAYAAFCCYRDLGDERSLARAAETYYGTRKNLAQVGLWSRKFDWVDRARAYEDWKARIRRDALEEAERERSSDFAERQRALDERILSLKERLVEKLSLMLEFPVGAVEKVEQEGEDGAPVIVHVHPVKWSFDSIVAALRVLARKSAGRLDLTGAGGEPFRFTLDLGEHEPRIEEEEED